MPRTRNTAALLLPFAFATALPASAGVLSLTPAAPIDISALNIASVGDLALVDQRIWVADGTTGGDLYAVVTATGLLHQTVDPSIVPGLTLGPDALGHVGVFDLFVFSSFSQSVAGRISTSGAGSLQSTFPSSHGATGADFGAGGLWIAAGTTAGLGSTLMRLDTTTGVVLDTVPIPGLTARIADIAFDGYSGGLYALCEDDQLRQIDVTTGAILATQDLSPFLIGHNSVAGGLEIGVGGTKVYIAYGAGAGSDQILVFDRSLAAEACGSQFGASGCPCANPGAVGHGCANSLPGSLGALLTTTGAADVSADTLALHATAMPPGTSALFFQGTSSPATPVAFGDGALCVNGTVIRLATKACPDGTATYPAAGDAAIHVRGQIPSTNTRRHYQTWYRNAAAFCTASTFNLTNAVVVDWQP
jgi:hypothetical protein